MQAGACSIRSRLRRSHGWLCSIRSRLRRSHSALLIHYKKVELKKKIDLHGIQTYIHQSRVECVTTIAHWTINFTENKCSIYIINCVWAAVCRNVGEVLARIVYPGIQSAVDGKQLELRRYKNKLRVPRRRALHFEQV